MQHTLYRIFLLLFLLLQLTSCITARRVNYLQEPGHSIPSYPNALPYEDYQLRVGDKLFVKVYSTHELTNQVFNSSATQNTNSFEGNNAYSDLYSYAIQTDGTIEFPMIGPVFMQGMTVREATRALEKAIEPLFLFSTVELRVLNRYFSVIGGGRTGYYPIIREKINIFQALALAGDVGMYADRSKIRVIRETPEGTIIRKFDLRSRDIINSEFYYIEPNDIIYVQTMDEQFFSIHNLPGLFATGISTVSFSVMLYNLFFGGGL